MANTVKDEMGNVVTLQGSAKTSAAQSQFGGQSLFIPGGGTTDRASIAYNSSLDFGASDWTIDFWAYIPTLPAGTTGLLETNTATSGYAQLAPLVQSTGAVIYYSSWSGTGWNIGAAAVGTLSAASWTHLAFCRTGGNLYAFLNGILGSTTAAAGTYFSDGSPWWVGVYTSFNSVAQYIDEFRVEKGVAKWTANFTPPSAQYSTDANTSALLHLDGTTYGQSLGVASGQTISYSKAKIAAKALSVAEAQAVGKKSSVGKLLATTSPEAVGLTKQRIVGKSLGVVSSQSISRLTSISKLLSSVNTQAIAVVKGISKIIGISYTTLGTPTAITAFATSTASGGHVATTVDTPIGSLIVVYVTAWNTQNSAITGVTDSAGNTYTQAAQNTATAGTYSTSIWYCSNTSFDLPNGGWITATTASGALGIQAFKVSGCNGAVGGVSTTAHTATATSLSLSTGALSSAAGIVFGAFAANGGQGTWTEGSGFSTLINNPQGCEFSYSAVSSSASVTWTPAWVTPQPYTAEVAFFATTAGGFQQSIGLSKGYPKSFGTTGSQSVSLLKGIAKLLSVGQGGANLATNISTPTSWGLNNTTSANNGTINGQNAATFTTTSSGSVGVFNNTPTISSVRAGDTYTYTLSFLAGTVSKFSMGILGSVDTWGAAGNGSGVILSGPGSISLNSGSGLWYITGLSATVPTTVQITRRNTQVQNFTGRVYINDTTGNNCFAGDSIVAAGPIIMLQGGQLIGLAKALSKALGVSSAQQSNLNIRFPKSLGAVNAQAINLLKGVAKLLPVQQGQSIRLTKSPAKALSIASPQVISLQKAVAKILGTSEGQSVAHQKSIGKSLQANQTQSVSVQKNLSKLLGVAWSESVGLTKSLGKSIGVSQSQQVNASKASNRLLGVISAQSVSMSRSIGHIASVLWTQAISLTKVNPLRLGVVQGQSVRATKATNKPLGTSQGQQISVARSLGKLLGINQGQSIGLRNAISKRLSMASPQVVNATKAISRSFGVLQGSVIGLARSVAVVRSVVQAQAQGLSKSVSKNLGIDTPQSVNISKSVGKRLGVATSQAIELSFVLVRSVILGIRNSQAISIVIVPTRLFVRRMVMFVRGLQGF